MAMMPMDLPCGATMELREGSLRMSININFPKELLQALSSPAPVPAPLPKADTAPRSAQPEQSEPQPEQPEPQPEQPELQPLRATNMAWGGNWEALGTAVRISNLSKRMNAEQVKELFEEHVGPVTECQVQNGRATVRFECEDLARKAIQSFDGGLVESVKDTGEFLLYQRENLRSCLEEHVGPLTKCQLRKGDGWATVFTSETFSQLKKTQQNGGASVESKAYFINVSREVSVPSKTPTASSPSASPFPVPPGLETDNA